MRADTQRYERIGGTYATTRREDPAIRSLIHSALGEARTVVNVGAGTGSYEPRDREVLAIEPSAVMARQRPADLTAPIPASADALPLRDGSMDAALAILTVHHWDDGRERGVRGLRRVARGPVVIVTYDPTVSRTMWLPADYLPELAELDREIFPTLAEISTWLGGDTSIRTVEISRDTPDWCLGSFWAHPERVLDPVARANTSGFARMSPDVVDRVVRAVGADLRSGTWEDRYGHLRALDTYDAGLRLIANQPA
jgi:SAM-dependent methyltransferase